MPRAWIGALALVMIGTGCLAQGTPPSAVAPAAEPDVPATNSTAEDDKPSSNETPPANGSTAEAQSDEASIESEITLMVGGSNPTLDRLGVTFTLPEGVQSASVTLTWDPRVPTQDVLALRFHGAGVLDAQGRLEGSTPLLAEVSGTSPLVLELDAPSLAGGTYDVHAFNRPEDDSAIVALQPFVLVARWS